MLLLPTCMEVGGSYPHGVSMDPMGVTPLGCELGLRGK